MSNEKPRDRQLLFRACKRAWHFLARVDVAAVLILIVLLLAGFGACFPQRPPSVSADSERLTRWEADVRGRYGSLTDLLGAIGVFHWFRSPFLWVPIAMLTLATLVCTLNRWRGQWRRAFHRPVRCSDATFNGAPHTAEISVSSAVDLTAVVREDLRRRGFRVRSELDGKVTHLRGDRYRWASLATLITHIVVPLLLLGAALSSVYGWREEVTLRPDETVDVRRGSGSGLLPELQLRNEGFTVMRHADGSVAGYEAQIAVVAEGREVGRGSIRLNDPLTYAGIGLYLQAYSEAADGYSVTLLAVHDPGFVPVLVAGFLLLLGLTVSFNFPVACVRAQIEPQGVVRLAGRADRRAWDFEREFGSLEEAIDRALGG